MRRTAEYARVFTRAKGRRDGPKEAKRKGDSKAAAEHADNADFTKEWANKGGCRWASYGEAVRHGADCTVRFTARLAESAEPSSPA